MADLGLSLSDIREAIQALGDRMSIKVEKDEKRRGVLLAAPQAGSSDYLDTGDLFKLLMWRDICYGGPSQNGACLEEIRQALDLPPTDPQGVTLNLRVAELEAGQVAIISFIPNDCDPGAKPIIFAGGLHHKTAVYFDFLKSLAIRERRPIYAFDMPGVGSSTLRKGSSVDHSLFTSALLHVVARTVPAGGHFDLIGHSLGTIPVRELYFLQKSGTSPITQVADRFVMVTPVPAERERKAGLSVDPNFLQLGALSATFTGEMTPALLDLFFQKHPESERGWLERVTGKEGLPVGPIGMMGSLYAVDDRPMLSELQSATNLVWMLAGDDTLIPLANRDAWEGRRNIILLSGADHSFLAGRSGSRWVGAVQEALHPPSGNPAPTIDPSRLMTGVRWNRAFQVEAGSEALTAGPQGEVSFSALPSLGVKLGANLMAGTDYDEARVPLTGYARLFVQTPNGHLSGGVGLAAHLETTEWDAGLRPEGEVQFLAAYDFWGMAQVTARINLGEGKEIDRPRPSVTGALTIPF